mmetsp:Transcript_21618/g.40707  ORF Transcript_21618/g.40707 Transcript_21618/m.40707 type:complete len:199 (-) Transcript_21618:272-868(-)
MTVQLRKVTVRNTFIEVEEEEALSLRSTALRRYRSAPPRLGQEDHSSRAGVQQDLQASKPSLQTTVFVSQIPQPCTRRMLLDVIDGKGFAGSYDFVYLPIHPKTRRGMGYAFVNLISHERAIAFMEAFEGYEEWPIASLKRCEVGWSSRQGFDANMKALKKSLLKESVPESSKPAVFQNGIRRPFPWKCLHVAAQSAN